MNKNLLDRLVEQMKKSLRGKRVYDSALVELIAKVGTAPSAAGARSPLAAIIKHVSDLVSDQLLPLLEFSY